MSIKKPNKPYPNPPATSPRSTPSPMPSYIHDPSILGVNFDQLLAQRGVRMIHKKAMTCMNVSSIDFQAHPADCTFCDGSGLIFYDEKEIWGTFYSNSLEKVFQTHGVWEAGTAVVTMPTTYADGTQADFNTYDRLLLPDFTVRMWELKQWRPNSQNKIRLKYPVESVEFASSIVDGVQKIYQEGVDFEITTEGDIRWIGSTEPRYDSSLDRGEVIGFAYFAHPVYVVVQTLRELRITQEMVNGVKRATRLPQQILVKRDFMVNPSEPAKSEGLNEPIEVEVEPDEE